MEKLTEMGEFELSDLHVQTLRSHPPEHRTFLLPSQLESSVTQLVPIPHLSTCAHFYSELYSHSRTHRTISDLHLFRLKHRPWCRRQFPRTLPGRLCHLVPLYFFASVHTSSSLWNFDGFLILDRRYLVFCFTRRWSYTCLTVLVSHLCHCSQHNPKFVPSRRFHDPFPRRSISADGKLIFLLNFGLVPFILGIRSLPMRTICCRFTVSCDRITLKIWLRRLSTPFTRLSNLVGYPRVVC